MIARRSNPPDPIPTFRQMKATEQAAADAIRKAWLVSLSGYSCAEAAKLADMDRSSIFRLAQVFGVKFHKAFDRPESPQFVLSQLTPKQLDDYRLFKVARYTRAEALVAVGRADLI